MNVVNQLWSRVSGYYRTLNPATLSGAIDIIVIQQPDGSLRSSPFHARFGKSGILRPQENVVELYVNDELIPDIQMQLGEAGEAFFLVQEEEETSEVTNVEQLEKQHEQEVLDQKDEDTGSEGSECDAKPLVSYYSDCEVEDHGFPTSGSRRGTLSGYKSDSDLDHDSRANVMGPADQLVAQMDWQWGQLPHSATMDSVKSGDFFDCSEEAAVGQALGERYLSELDDRNRHLYISGYAASPESGYKSDLEASVEEDLNVGVRLSLCGGLDGQRGVTTERFLQHLVTYEEFMQNPDIMENKDLVVRVDGKNYNWRAAAPQLLCRAAFGLPLPHRTDVALRQRYMHHRRKRNVRSWFPWGAGAAADDFKDEEPADCDQEREQFSASQSAATSVESLAPGVKEPIVKDQTPRLVRTVRLSSEQLHKLRLRIGYNELRYSVTTKYQGTTACTCGVYLWNFADRIVVSDIDGTITKSDVLGHVLPMVGRDWTQPKIAQLFSAVEANGYRFVYLSARAIGQSGVTRRFLQRVRQEGIPLPDGPVLLSPLSLLRAFHMEVIARRPEAFKIACLKDVRALYPDSVQPFWAGFGNRPSDALSYKEVGVPTSRCFTVNPQGEVKENNDKWVSSYAALSEVADHMFPPPKRRLAEESDFSHFVYWREPLPAFLPPPRDPDTADCDMLP